IAARACRALRATAVSAGCRQWWSETSFCLFLARSRFWQGIEIGEPARRHEAPIIEPTGAPPQQQSAGRAQGEIAERRFGAGQVVDLPIAAGGALYSCRTSAA